MPLNLALEPLFGWFGGSEDGVCLEKIQHAEAVHRRAHHDLRAVELELRRDNRALHDLRRSKHRREAAGRVSRLGLGPPVTSTATSRSARPIRWSNGSGLTAPPSTRRCPPCRTGLTRPGVAIEPATAPRRCPLWKTASVRAE